MRIRNRLGYGIFSLLILGAVAVTATFVIGAQTAKKPLTMKESIKSGQYGNITLDYISPATTKDLVLPFYPAATIDRSWRYSAVDKGGRPAGFLAQAFLTTPDTPAQVIAFYKSKLDKTVGVEPKPNGGAFLYLTKGTDTLTVRITADPKSNKTKIELNRAGPPKSPLAIPQDEPRKRRGDSDGTLI